MMGGHTDALPRGTFPPPFCEAQGEFVPYAFFPQNTEKNTVNIFKVNIPNAGELFLSQTPKRIFGVSEGLSQEFGNGFRELGLKVSMCV